VLYGHLARRRAHVLQLPRRERQLRLRPRSGHDGARWLHISGYALLEGRQRAATLALIDAAGAHDIPISLDLCLPQLRATRGETLDLLPRLRILFANEPELAALTAIDRTTKGQPNASVERIPDPLGEPGALAIESLLERGVGTVAVKLGPRGCLVANTSARHYAPAFAVEAIDTNGCGDAFVAGFLFAHMRGAAPDQCAILANAIGALKATRLGAAEALPDRATLYAFLTDMRQNSPLADLLSI
jgi:sugar/nucleoside kinase (ribokinase family)